MSVIKAVWKAVRIRKARRSFARCELGQDVTFGPYAMCSGPVRDDGAARRPSVRIGSHVFIDCALFTRGSGTITIGSDCWIGGSGSTAIGAVESVTIDSNVMISNHVHIYDNNNHPTDPARRHAMTSGEHFGPLWEWTESDAAPVVIGNNVWIGEFSLVLKGVTIGEGSVVAAHSVVTKDIPASCVVAGNSARVVKRLAHG